MPRLNPLFTILFILFILPTNTVLDLSAISTGHIALEQLNLQTIIILQYR